MFIDEDRQVFELGKTVRRKDFLTVSQHGKQAYHDVIKLPLRDEEGRVTALLTVAEDITERRQAQLELERYQQELEGIITQRTLALEAAQEDLIRRERLATIGQITGTVAHELRNPLGTIQTSALFLNKLLRDSDPRVARILGRVERNIL